MKLSGLTGACVFDASFGVRSRVGVELKLDSAELLCDDFVFSFPFARPLGEWVVCRARKLLFGVATTISSSMAS